MYSNILISIVGKSIIGIFNNSEANSTDMDNDDGSATSNDTFGTSTVAINATDTVEISSTSSTGDIVTNSTTTTDDTKLNLTDVTEVIKKKPLFLHDPHVSIMAELKEVKEVTGVTKTTVITQGTLDPSATIMPPVNLPPMLAGK